MTIEDSDCPKLERIEASLRQALSECITDTVQQIALIRQKDALTIKLGLLDYIHQHSIRRDELDQSGNP